MGKQLFLGLRGARLTTMIVFVAGAKFLLFGYDQGVVGGLLNLPSFTKTFPSLYTTADCLSGMSPGDRSDRSTTQGVAVASYNLGCLIGAISTFKLGNLLGRRMPIFLGCVIVSTGAILQASAFSLVQFVIDRVICGLGTGFNTATMPVWQAECTKPHQRGPIMAFETSLVTAGVMISYWIDFGLSYAEPSDAAGVCHFRHGSHLLAAGVAPMWGWGCFEELDEIDSAIEAEHLTDWTAVIKQGPVKARTRTMLAVSIQIMSQFSGINVAAFYATSIFHNGVGLSPFISRVLAGCLGATSFIAAMGSVVLIKYFGRRQVLLFNLSGMCSSMIALAVAGKIRGYSASIASAAFLFTFMLFFSLGFAQIPWIYPTEITPLATRVQANALSTPTNWACVFTVVVITPIAFNNIGWRTYLIFACCSAFAMVVQLIEPHGSSQGSKLTQRHFNKGEPIKGHVADFQHIEEV